MQTAIIQKLQDYIKTRSPVRTYAKGQVITLAGQDPRGVAFLESGVVEQYDITSDGNKITVNVFKPPAFFPMSWAINKTPNAYFFEALDECKIRWADPDETVNFLKENPDVLLDLLGRVYKGTDGLLRRLVLAASGAATQRLMYELLLEAYRFGVPAGDHSRRVRVRQHALAARTGLTRETVSRELHRLLDDGIVMRSPQGMIINIPVIEARLNDS